MPDASDKRQLLSQTELALHLAVDRASVKSIAGKCGLAQDFGRYSWRRILRHVHKIDPTRLEPLGEQLSDALVRLGGGSIQDQLREPLMTFEQVAQALGYRPDTLSKAARQGRIELPVPTLFLGPRLRRFRPLDLRVWKDFGVAIPYPVPATPTEFGTELKPAGSPNLARPPESAVALVFGAFGRN